MLQYYTIVVYNQRKIKRIFSSLNVNSQTGTQRHHQCGAIQVLFLPTFQRSKTSEKNTLSSSLIQLESAVTQIL